MEERYAFSSNTSSMTHCAAGANHYGNGIKNIDEINATLVYPSCGTEEDWGYVILCEKSKKHREEWAKEM